MAVDQEELRRREGYPPPDEPKSATAHLQVHDRVPVVAQRRDHARGSNGALRRRPGQTGSACGAAVDPDAPLLVRDFHVVPTGGNEPEGARFVGTVLLSGGSLVFHIFEAVP